MADRAAGWLFYIALEMRIEATCNAGKRGGFEQIYSLGAKDDIYLELYYIDMII